MFYCAVRKKNKNTTTVNFSSIFLFAYFKSVDMYQCKGWVMRRNTVTN